MKHIYFWLTNDSRFCYHFPFHFPTTCRKFISIYERYKAKKKTCDEGHRAASHLSFVTQILMTLLPATVVLIFIPSLIFSYFEGWPYKISVYYCLETLIPIALGDYIPTYQPDQESKFGVLFVFYEIFVLVWMMFGLMYFLMLIALIAKAMHSKRLVRLNDKLSRNLMATHGRIWNGVVKEVGVMRNVLADVLLRQAEVRLNLILYLRISLLKCISGSICYRRRFSAAWSIEQHLVQI